MPGLDIWTIYDHPKDHPNHWVARRWRITAGGHRPDDFVVKADSLEQLRSLLPVGLTRIERSDGDDPNIVESWL